MDLKNQRPSKNVVDDTFKNVTDRLFASIREKLDPYEQVQSNDMPEGYSRWIADQLKQLTPQDVKDLHSGNVNLNDLMYLKALKKYGPGMVDPNQTIYNQAMKQLVNREKGEY